MVLKTRVTEILGIKHPIVCGGMMWVGVAELAAAVSNAGGLGIITALTQPTPEDLRKEIRKLRTLTDKPFAVNLTILPAIVPPPYEEYANVIIEEGVKIVETAGNNPKKWVAMFKKAGIICIHKAVAVRHAKTAQRVGVDIISVDGFECAGHPGEDDIPNMVLLARCAAELDVPFIASGGIGDGRGLAAALALGADGINMGTRFMCTTESRIHENIKKQMVESDERDTVLMFRTLRNTARVFKNKISKEVVRIESLPGKTDFKDLAALVSGRRGRTVYEGGDPDAGIWSAGVVMGLIHDIPTCKDLIERIANDAETIIRDRLSGILSSKL
uniref:2-nitropropane dioxygenase n=1 Tax=Hirondellea gigas TaxID=1518452 RepID=A0A6A7G8D2_9CRUS